MKRETAGRIALRGFSRVRLFKIVKNDTEGYEVGESFVIPEAQSMTKSANIDSETIYADDNIYMEMTSWNGLELEITFAEMLLQKMAELGFGEYSESSGELDWDPQGKGLEFGLTFRALLANGRYRMYKMYVFAISGVDASGLQTRGGGVNIAPYVIRGIVKRRTIDDKVGPIKDSQNDEDMEWLEEIPSKGESSATPDLDPQP